MTSQRERIIPIQVEERSEAAEVSTTSTREESPESEQLSKSLEELSVEPKSPNLSTSISSKIIVKPAPNFNEYLKEYEIFEKRTADINLPNYDVLERIILVIDRAQDENYTPFIIGTQKCTPLSIIKRAISIFMKLKLGINPNTQFAIITMNQKDASLCMDFTNDIRKLNDRLKEIEECETEDIFNLNCVFNIIKGASLPEPVAPGLPPTTMFRTIIYYGRSYTIPKITIDEQLEVLLENPYFVVDVFITHEPVESSNRCKEIFQVLQNIDKKGLSYFLPVSRNLRRLHKYNGKLLGHPLQRPIQKLLK